MRRPAKSLARWMLLFALLLAAMHGALAGQQSGPPRASTGPPPVNGRADDGSGDAVFKAQIDRVVLNAAVLDGKQQLITGLPQEAFRVTQDGKAVTLSGFSNRDIPVSMGLIVDSSASMSNKRSSVNRAALALVRASHPEDEVFVINFNDEAVLTQDFTNKISALEHGLSDVQMFGGTALLDAVQLAMDHLRQGVKGKKILLVITDGEDNASRIVEKSLNANLQKSDVTVYAIGLLNEESSSARTHARRMLRQITEISGGAAYFPEGAEGVEALAAKIANDIRNQYVLEFAVPEGTKPGPHVLHVEVKSAASGKLTVRTRTGYVYQPATG